MNVLDRVRVADEHRRTWQLPITLSGLGFLVADWLEGALPHNPDYPGGGPDAETLPLVPVLAPLNRTGLIVTASSQPGELGYGKGGRVWRQRAAVEGFCTDGALKLLRIMAANTDQIVLRFARPSRHWRPSYAQSIEVTQTRKGHFPWRTHTDFGAVIPRHRIGDTIFPGVHAELIKKLQRSWWFTLVDLQWARNQALWPLLAHFTELVAAEGSQHPLAAAQPSGRHWVREDW